MPDARSQLPPTPVFRLPPQFGGVDAHSDLLAHPLIRLLELVRDHDHILSSVVLVEIEMLE